MQIHKIAFLFIFSGVVFCLPALAEEAMPTEELGRTFDTSAYDKINEVKANILSLLQQNKQLELQYVVLSEEYTRLKEGIDMFAEEISEMTKTHLKQKDLQNEKVASMKKLHENLNSLNDELLIKKSRNAYLSATALETDSKIKILQLKLQDLELAQRQLQMSIKQKEFAASEAKRTSEVQIVQLREQIQSNIEKTESILKDMDKMEQESKSYESTIESLSFENTDLENRVTEHTRRQELRDKETALLKNKRLLSTRKADNILFEKEQERNALKEEVDKLTTELNDLKSKVTLSFSRQGTKRELINSMMNIDKENQELKEKLKVIQEKIDKLE